jgi:hypothetical protein
MCSSRLLFGESLTISPPISTTCLINAIGFALRVRISNTMFISVGGPPRWVIHVQVAPELVLVLVGFILDLISTLPPCVHVARQVVVADTIVILVVSFLFDPPG